MAGRSRQQKKVDIRKFRSDVAKLKKAGLLSDRVDARKQRATRYMREQVKKFDDVLAGKAKTVPLKSKSLRDDYSAYRQKNKHLVVPVQNPKSKLTIKDGEVQILTRQNGRRLRQTLFPRRRGEELNVRSPGERNMRFTFTFPKGGGSYTSDDWEDFQNYMKTYEVVGPRRKEPFDWRPYVTATEIMGDGSARVVDTGL